MEEGFFDFFERAVRLAKKLEWEVYSIDFMAKEVGFRALGPYKTYHRLTVGYVFLQSLEATVEGK